MSTNLTPEEVAEAWGVDFYAPILALPEDPSSGPPSGMYSMSEAKLVVDCHTIEIKKLKEKLLEKSTMLEGKEKEVIDWERKAAKLTEELEMERRFIADLEKEITGWSDLEKQFRTVQRELEESVQKNRERNAQLEMELAHVHREISRLEAKAENLVDEIQALEKEKEKIQQLEDEKQAEANARAEAEQQVKKLSEELEAMKKKLEEAQKKAKSEEQEYSDYAGGDESSWTDESASGEKSATVAKKRGRKPGSKRGIFITTKAAMEAASAVANVLDEGGNQEDGAGNKSGKKSGGRVRRVTTRNCRKCTKQFVSLQAVRQHQKVIHPKLPKRGPGRPRKSDVSAPAAAAKRKSGLKDPQPGPSWAM